MVPYPQKTKELIAVAHSTVAIDAMSQNEATPGT